MSLVHDEQNGFLAAQVVCELPREFANSLTGQGVREHTDIMGVRKLHFTTTDVKTFSSSRKTEGTTNVSTNIG